MRTKYSPWDHQLYGVLYLFLPHCLNMSFQCPLFILKDPLFGSSEQATLTYKYAQYIFFSYAVPVKF
jgi:hypothetical protein